MSSIAPFVNGDPEVWTSRWLTSQLRPLDDETMLELIADRAILVGAAPRKLSFKERELPEAARSAIESISSSQSQLAQSPSSEALMSKYISVYNKIVRVFERMLRVDATSHDVLSPTDTKMLLRRVFAFQSETFQNAENALLCVDSVASAAKSLQILDPYIFGDDGSQQFLIRLLERLGKKGCKFVTLQAPLDPKWAPQEHSENRLLNAQKALRNLLSMSVAALSARSGSDEQPVTAGSEPAELDASPPLQGSLELELVPFRSRLIHDRVWVFNPSNTNPGAAPRGRTSTSFCVAMTNSISRLNRKNNDAPFSMIRMPADQAVRLIDAFQSADSPRVVIRLNAETCTDTSAPTASIRSVRTNEECILPLDKVVTRAMALLYRPS